LKPLLLIFLFLFPVLGRAEWISSSRGSGPTLNRGIKFRLLGGLKLQRATMMSKNDFVEKRSLNGIGVDSVAGVNIGPLLLGAGAAYTKFYQSTEKKDVGGTDTTGDLTSFHGVAGIGLGKLCFMARYIFKADYKLAQKTVSNETAAYSKPTASYGLSLMYRPGGRSFWSVDYTNVNFSEMKIGSTKTKLSSDDSKINLNSFGITYGVMF
jgi:hypothetical protein